MLLYINKEHIIDGLQKVANIIPTRSGAAYLRTLWMKAENSILTIMATDANIEFTGNYTANIKEPGLVGVNGRNLVDLIRRLPAKELCLRLDSISGTLIIEQERRTYKMPVNDPVWFQPLSLFPSEESIIWSADFFQEVIDRVSFCISDDEGSDAISCCYIQKSNDNYINVCGLNGHQFALTRFINNELSEKIPNEGILIPKKYISELRKWLGEAEIEVAITEKRFFARLIDGKETISVPRALFTYPDYTAFLTRLTGDNMSYLKIQRKDCLESLDRISIFNTEGDRCTYFDIKKNELVLFTQGQDTGSANEYLDVTYTGNINKIAFPTKNLMEIFNHFESSTITLAMSSVEGPCGITGEEDKDYTVIIMPMKIVEQNYYTEEA